MSGLGSAGRAEAGRPGEPARPGRAEQPGPDQPETPRHRQNSARQHDPKDPTEIAISTEFESNFCRNCNFCRIFGVVLTSRVLSMSGRLGLAWPWLVGFGVVLVSRVFSSSSTRPQNRFRRPEAKFYSPGACPGCWRAGGYLFWGRVDEPNFLERNSACQHDPKTDQPRPDQPDTPRHRQNSACQHDPKAVGQFRRPTGPPGEQLQLVAAFTMPLDR